VISTKILKNKFFFAQTFLKMESHTLLSAIVLIRKFSRREGLEACISYYEYVMLSERGEAEQICEDLYGKEEDEDVLLKKVREPLLAAH